MCVCMLLCACKLYIYKYYKHTYIHTYIHIYIDTYICIYMYVYICIIYIYMDDRDSKGEELQICAS